MIHSELSQLEAMMMSDQQTHRHDQALTSFPDQLSTSLEERAAPVAVEEEAGILSRFVSYLKPSYLWKKLALSRTMRFLMPHIYLRHSSDIPAAGGILFMKARADEAQDLFGSQEFQTWSKYFTNAFPDNLEKAADNMVLTLVRYFKDKLVYSIANTKFDDGKLAFDAPFEAALIRYIVNAKKDKSPSRWLIPIGERLEKGIRGDGISSSEENLVNGDRVQPVQRSSSHEEVIDKHVISITPSRNDQEAIALTLLKNVGLDKEEKYIFSSNEFVQWSEQIAEIYRKEPREGVRVMWTTLAKHDLEKLKKSISDTKVVDGKLAFGDRFKDSLIDYIAIAEDVEDLKSFAIHLEDSLFSLCRKLVKGETPSIGENLEDEVFTLIVKSNKNLNDIFNHPSVRSWYHSMFLDGEEHALSVVNLKLMQHGFTSEQIGEAYRKPTSEFVRYFMSDLALYRLRKLSKDFKPDKVTSDSISNFEALIQEAFYLQPQPEDVLKI
ncbi:hypothetical protein Plhal304r1_c071g0159491 [Plasmopara halstedii]